MREDRVRKNARAVIIALAAIGAKHVVVCTVLVIVLQKVIKLGRPVDKLPLLEFVQHMTDIGCILRIDDEEIEDVRKNYMPRTTRRRLPLLLKMPNQARTIPLFHLLVRQPKF
jgi:hypothetical protein